MRTGSSGGLSQTLYESSSSVITSSRRINALDLRVYDVHYISNNSLQIANNNSIVKIPINCTFHGRVEQKNIINRPRVTVV